MANIKNLKDTVNNVIYAIIFIAAGTIAGVVVASIAFQNTQNDASNISTLTTLVSKCDDLPFTANTTAVSSINVTSVVCGPWRMADITISFQMKDVAITELENGGAITIGFIPVNFVTDQIITNFFTTTDGTGLGVVLFYPSGKIIIAADLQKNLVSTQTILLHTTYIIAPLLVT